MNHKKTSPSVASKAARTLRSKSASRTQKKLVASALSQTRGTRKTGKKMEKVASAVLNSPKYADKTKTFAGSVLSQSDKKR